MPKTYVRKSAVKTQRNSEKARVKNKSRRNMLSTMEKKFRATAAEDKSAAVELFQDQCSALDKAAKVGVIHKNKANRKKSRLAALVKKEAKAE